MLLNVVVDCFFIAHKPGREHKGTNVSLILKDGEHMLPHDWLHHSHHIQHILAASFIILTGNYYHYQPRS